MDVKFNIINIQHEKVNCTYTHIVTQEYLVTVSNVTHTISCKSKEIQKYEGLSHAVTGLHATANSSQEIWWPHFCRNGNGLPPCSCYATTTQWFGFYEMFPPHHNFLCISNLIPKLRCTLCFRKWSIIFVYLSCNSLTGQPLWPILSAMMLELIPVQEMENEPYIPDSCNKF